MKRISLLFIVVVMMFASGLTAQNNNGQSSKGQSNNGANNSGANNNFDDQFDDKLKDLRKKKSNDTVKVIIQGITPAYIPPHVVESWGKLLKQFNHFNGFVMEMKVKDLDKLQDLHKLLGWKLRISVDEPLKGQSAIDGLEP